MSSLDQKAHFSILSPYQLDGNGNQQEQSHLISFLPTYVTPSFTYHRPFYASQMEEEACLYGFYHQEQIAHVEHRQCQPPTTTGSIDPPPPPLRRHGSNAAATDDDDDQSRSVGGGKAAKHKQAIPDAAPRSTSTGSAKWIMSSKMRRLMRKMDDGGVIISAKKRNGKQLQPQSQELEENGSSSSSSNIAICNDPARVCSDCNTTKTPLWRSGPQGPKSLCNACGIRQRKARKAISEGVEKGGGANKHDPVVVPYKKRSNKSETTPRDGEKLHDLNGLNSSVQVLCHEEPAPPQRVFAQDEKEAAFLLMALSSGLTLVCN